LYKCEDENPDYKFVYNRMFLEEREQRIEASVKDAAR